MSNKKTTNKESNGKYVPAKTVNIGVSSDTKHKKISGRTVITNKSSGKLRVVYTPMNATTSGKSTKK